MLIPNGLRVFPLSMRYASVAFRALSLLDLMSSSGISVMSVLLAGVFSLTIIGELACSQIQNLEEWNLGQIKGTKKKTEKKVSKMQLPASSSTRYG